MVVQVLHPPFKEPAPAGSHNDTDVVQRSCRYKYGMYLWWSTWSTLCVVLTHMFVSIGVTPVNNTRTSGRARVVLLSLSRTLLVTVRFDMVLYVRIAV